MWKCVKIDDDIYNCVGMSMTNLLHFSVPHLPKKIPTPHTPFSLWFWFWFWFWAIAICTVPPCILRQSSSLFQISPPLFDLHFLSSFTSLLIQILIFFSHFAFLQFFFTQPGIFPPSIKTCGFTSKLCFKFFSFDSLSSLPLPFFYFHIVFYFSLSSVIDFQTPTFQNAFLDEFFLKILELWVEEEERGRNSP